MSIVSEAQQTFLFFTLQEFGFPLSTDKMHIVEKKIDDFRFHFMYNKSLQLKPKGNAYRVDWDWYVKNVLK